MKSTEILLPWCTIPVITNVSVIKKNNIFFFTDKIAKKPLSRISNNSPYPNIAIKPGRTARRIVAAVKAVPGKFQSGIGQTEGNSTKGVQRSGQIDRLGLGGQSDNRNSQLHFLRFEIEQAQLES